MQSKPKWERDEENMNQREQETHPKLTCSCLLSLLSPSLVSSPLRSMEPTNSLPCDPSNGFLPPDIRLPSRICFLSPVSIFHSKPLPALLFLHQPTWLPSPTSMAGHHVFAVSVKLLSLQKGVPHLPRVLPAAGDDEAPFQCHKKN